MWPIRNRNRRAPRAAAIVLGALIVCALLHDALVAPMARAAIGACGSDPVVVLSNGTELEFSTVIADVTADVQQVRYTLHVPRGTSVALSLAGALGAEEQWTVTADMPARTYEVVTHVTADAPGGAVTVTAQALGLIGIALDVASGQVDQDLIMQFTI